MFSALVKISKYSSMYLRGNTLSAACRIVRVSLY